MTTIFGAARRTLLDELEAWCTDGPPVCVLYGPSGVGKTAIVNALVRRMADEGRALHERTDVWAVDGNRIIAGMSMVGAWEQRCKDMVAELEARRDVLYVDDLPALVYTGRSAQSDAHVAQYLEPHLAAGDLRVIGECTPERLEAARDEAPGFFSRFQIVPVPELSETETLMVLVHAVRAIEAREPALVAPEALDGILALTRRFQRRRCHPGKAVSLLQRLVDDHQDIERDDLGRRLLDRPRLIDFFARQTGLPRFVLWEQQARPFAEIEAHFQRRIIGQAAAARAAAEVVNVLQQGLDDPQRPLATMLFVGPTGVGKTECGKALAEYLFGTADRLIRFDMSEFCDPWSTARLFGDRLRPEGELTRRVEQQPFSVVLFDEIEKAHPRVFDAFLQVFGEGRLTNAAGRTTDFCNAILIMTSNLGVKQAQRSLGFAEPTGTRQDAHFRQAAEFFRPEFFNRIDRIVAFRSLGRESLGPLVERTLVEILSRRGLRRSGVMVEVEPSLVELLVDQGFDPRYGARSLRRALEQRLTVPLAHHLVSQPVDRTTTIELFRSGDDIGLRLQALDDAVVEVIAPPPLDDWAALQTRYAALAEDLTALQAHPGVASLTERRGALLDAFNAGQLDATAMAGLEVANRVLAEVAALMQAIDAFGDDYLARYDYTEVVETISVHHGFERNWNAKHRRDRVVGTAVPMVITRDAIFAEAVEALRDLERRCAAAAWRAEVADLPAEFALLRLLPVSDAPEARLLAGTLAAAHHQLWYPWGDLEALERRDGQWAPARKPSEDDPPPTGHALFIRGHGMRALVEAEVGYHLRLEHRGPDLVCALVRLDEVWQAADGIDDALAHLQALDAALEDWRAARRRGEAGVDPLPPLPVRRRARDGVAEDTETGVRVDLSGGTSAAQGLAEVLARRLLARQRAGRGGD
ncbi:MAG: ATP-dependent Clp protease ATP-binding subunit [Myxococcales bacterium]|nr:ATP-dependent Clp protease ATP-binding subunit [Myxococcales bacterium]